MKLTPPQAPAFTPTRVDQAHPGAVVLGLVDHEGVVHTFTPDAGFTRELAQHDNTEHNATGEYACTECGHRGRGQVPGCSCVGCDDAASALDTRRHAGESGWLRLTFDDGYQSEHLGFELLAVTGQAPAATVTDQTP